MDWVLAFFIGMGTALVELLSRYRDEPIKVIATSEFAWLYLLLNGGMALGAHAILLDTEVTTVDTNVGRATLAMGSGLSAALVLRARVFTARLGDEQVSIGPGYIVDQLLGIIDAQIDRRRALQRVSIVVGLMDGKEFDGSRIHASTMILGSRQNLSLQEQKDLANQIREVEVRKISDQEKAYALGFILLDFMGESFLKAVAEKLPRVEEPPQATPHFVSGGITETGSGMVSKRTWGASMPVQRAKVVRELLTGVALEAVRKRTVELLDSGQLGTNEDERTFLRGQIAEILGRESSEEDKVFALGFAVHSLWDSVRFRDHFGELPRTLARDMARELPEGREREPAGRARELPSDLAKARPRDQSDEALSRTGRGEQAGRGGARRGTGSTRPVGRRLEESSDDADHEMVDISMSGVAFDAEDSGSDRPKTGSHPTINVNAGPLPIAKKDSR
ncbi:hypothetical protein DB30_02202 [Enhygromyxa salina]|uniref:Uncharacterized protein n=1 Tax=Enhygromyxa salina TaxID=215803 RepID=A0A0C2DE96_9BACT|nr:hypothetical protein [Enhygromyxa salina]KIG17987.1 hypothetical protein DB30_02202 [Enhygromyxa salina]